MAPKLLPVSKRQYVPVLSAVERAAYMAAHRILSERTHEPELACDGCRRSRQIDRVAAIIVEAIGK